MKGINLGCGTRIFKSTPELEWVNIDKVRSPGVDLVADWRTCLKGMEADIIVAHHTFEHQGCGEQPIQGCYDALLLGGSLIVSVPDLRKLTRMWLMHEMDTQLFMTNVYGPYNGMEESRHRWGFDSDSLRTTLKTSPWREVKPFNWRAIPGADIARDDKWILCLEAIR